MGYCDVVMLWCCATVVVWRYATVALWRFGATYSNSVVLAV